MKRQRVKLGRPDRRQCRKVTLLLSSSTDIRLSVLAAVRRVDRSALADELLGQQLRGVSVEVEIHGTGEAA